MGIFEYFLLFGLVEKRRNTYLNSMANEFYILIKYLTYPRGRSFNKFSPAFENGINFFDISEPFTSARAEVELGRIIKKAGWSRRQFVVSTKVYWDKWDKDNQLRNNIYILFSQDGRKGFVKERNNRISSRLIEELTTGLHRPFDHP